MTSPEVYYLHIHGEQRGPYTQPQVDHLLNSGLIAEETLYWREGLEQWQPVTSLVIRRVPPNHWRRWTIAAAVTLVLLVLAQFFGPITIIGWREANQHDFTERAAYWRARDAVRNGALAPGTLVEFADLPAASVRLHAPDRASVRLGGQVTGSNGIPRPAAWDAAMKFDPATREWSNVSVQEVAP
jgi:GYF domain 2